MAAYVDGFVIPIAKNKVDAYRRMAKLASKVWMEHGALEFRECVGEDLDVPFGPGFRRGLKLKRNQTVMFSWIVFKSRAHRDRVNAKAMKDPRLDSDQKDMPFDAKRMLWGGFTTLVTG